jgi:hypothetical protein
MKLDFEKLDRMAAAGMTAQAMIEMLRIEDERERAPLTVVEFPDHRRRLFSEGLAQLSRITGKGPDSCRSFVGRCLKAAGDDAVIVLGLIEDAERNMVANPTAWIMACLKSMDIRNGKNQGTVGQMGRRGATGGSLLAAIDTALQLSQDADLAAAAHPLLGLSGGSIR